MQHEIVDPVARAIKSTQPKTLPALDDWRQAGTSDSIIAINNNPPGGTHPLGGFEQLRSCACAFWICGSIGRHLNVGVTKVCTPHNYSNPAAF
jgi:hypothetical protein